MNEFEQSEKRCEFCKRTGCYFHPDMAKERGLDIDHSITIPTFIERFGCGSFEVEDRVDSSDTSPNNNLLSRVGWRMCGVKLSPPSSNKKPISRKKLLAFLQSAKMINNNIDNTNRYLYTLGNNRLADNLYVSLMCGDLDEGEGE